MCSKMTKHFFVAGKCFFTVKVPEAFASSHGDCKLHYTFKVEQAEATEQYPEPKHFVKLLAGPDNTQDYKYLGVLNKDTGEVRLTARSFAGEQSWPVRIIRRVLAQMFEGEGVAAIKSAGWDIDHMGKCARCGRPLTVPESLEVGIGPDCAEMMGIPYPSRTKASKPRKKKETPVVERDPASDQEPPQTPVLDNDMGNLFADGPKDESYPPLPADDEVWF